MSLVKKRYSEPWKITMPSLRFPTHALGKKIMWVLKN